MAEADAEKVPSLSEDYLLEEKAEKQEIAAETVKESEVKPIIDAPIEESAAATVEAIEDVTVTEAPAPEVEDVTRTEASAPEVEGETTSVAAEESKESSPTEEAQADDPKTSHVEESTESEESENAGNQESEKPAEIKLETAPADFRFPTTNQTRHCFTRYIEYHRCIAAKGDGSPECDKFAKYYRSLCPGEWVERWNEQRENGTFPGPL